ncbi:MAG: penicillin-binding protein 2 [Chthoniobacterales bacterium]
MAGRRTEADAARKPLLRVHILALVFLAAFGLLVAQMWNVQVLKCDYYTKQILNSSQVTVRIPSVRGEIKDRNGLSLVRNRASYEVDFLLPAMVQSYKKENRDVPKLKYEKADANGRAQVKEETDIVTIIDSAIQPRLRELQLDEPYSTSKLRSHFKTKQLVPFTYRQDVDFPTFAKYAERDIGLPGIKVGQKPVREYVYGALAAQILGYVGEPRDISAQPDIDDFTYYEADVQGRTNLEKTQDELLKGAPGARVLKKNVKGQIEGEIREDPPQRGSDVYLTIDAKIQYIAEKAMRSVGRGAAVVVDPNNGEVLAMVSVPSFNPNNFIPSISTKNWAALKDADADPLTNRAISAYAPGSTYKLPIALAGLKSGHGNDHYNCSGGVSYGNTYMRCWIGQQGGAHGDQDLENALKNSCNAFFFQYGNAAGIGPIDQMCASLGLGQQTGIELSNENGGVLPGKEWLAKHHPKERWGNANTALTSIGQQYVEASPLQMAMIGATVANGGTCYYPTLIHKSVGPDGVETLHAPRVRADLLKNGLTSSQIERVRHGMWKVVNDPDGTGKKARVPGCIVAGKTGTAQFKRKGVPDNHTWFVCFAPYDKPTLAICIFIEGAKSGGGTAAPIASKIIKDVMAMKGGYNPDLKPIKPAIGNFNFVETIDFERNLPATPGDEDGETADSVPHNDVVAKADVRRSDQDAPNIETEADEHSIATPKAVSADELKKKFLLQRDQKPVSKPRSPRG